MVNHQGAWLQTISGIKNAVASNLFVMTNTTLLEVNGKPELLSNTLDFLASLKVPTVGFNALIYSGRGLEVKNGIQESELPNLLEIARQKTTQYQQKLIWYTPTQYCHFDPMQMDLGIKGCTAALYNMCIEPDGSVLPCQSYYSPVGNILSEPWENIWNHDLAVNLRERRFIADSCRECELLQVCGGGCPLAHQAGQMAEPQPVLSFL
jgi:radical SAM protein with 4Fe4S-binding SPASM domain